MIACGVCGRENPAEAAFCMGCGAVLEAPVARRAHRKTVTVLFCDVTGSTAMGEQLDPESLRQVMRRYFDAARTVVQQHGGTVEKFIGDAVMAVFGIPTLHEDDALRAVRAAVELREALTVLNVELERDFATSVTTRTGVNTGQVVTGTEERLATGDAVNLAARLEQAAAPGEILIGQETWRLVRDWVTTEPLAPLQLKGKSLPVTAYRLARLNTEGFAAPAGLKTPMVGRATPMRMLRNAFASVTDARSCNLFTVLGAAGVGKSRLTAEFLRGIDATVLRGRCLSYGEGITYWPVIEIVKQLLEIDGGSEAAALMSRDLKVEAAINTILGANALATSSIEIAWAVRKLLECAAEARPAVVVFDDLHWGEPTLFDLIEHIADLSRGAPILVLCLARPELLDRRPGWGGGKLNATTALLEPLNAEETEALLDELLNAGDHLDAELRARVRVTAAGNPLFVEEIVAMMRESTTHEIIVPPNIKALLAARFDQLRPEERGVLECGAVEGQSFHRGAVEVMTAGENDVAASLIALVQKDLLRPDRPVFPDEESFAFRHILIRDAAYDSLPKSERAALHASFAGWLLQRGGDLEGLDEIVGYHLEQSFRYRAELGPPDDGARALGADAARHLEAAGRRALDRGDTTAAVNLLERAELVQPARQVDPGLEVALIEGLAMSGRLNDAITRSERAATRFAAVADEVSELEARLIGAVWRFHVDPATFEDLRAAVERARPVIESSGDDRAVAVLEMAAGWAENLPCRFENEFKSLSRSIRYATRADELWLARSTRSLAAIAVAVGPMPAEEAQAWLEREQVEGGGFAPMLDIWRAWVLGIRGRSDEARSLFDATLEQMTERGLRTEGAAAMQARYEIERLAGNPEAAERVARIGCEQLELLGERGYQSTLECQLGEALYRLGRYDEAEQSVHRGVKLGGSHDVVNNLLALEIRAKVSARRGDHVMAVALAQQAENLAGAIQAPLFKGDAALALAEVLHLAGDKEGADAATRRAIESYEAKGATGYTAYARRIAGTWGP